MDPFTLSLILGGAGALLGGIQGLGSGGGLFGGYSQIGGPENVTNINPFTDATYGTLSNDYNTYKNLLGGFDYTAPFQAFTSQIAPELSGLATNDQFSQAQLDLARRQSADIRSGLEQEYAAGGNLFSSAFGEALGRGVAAPQLQAIADITGQQNQTRNLLFQSVLSTLPGLYGSQFDRYAGLAGQALGGLTEYGMPTFYEPSYGYSPGLLGGALQGFGSGFGFGTSLGGMPGFGGGGGGAAAAASINPANVWGMEGRATPGFSPGYSSFNR